MKGPRTPGIATLLVAIASVAPNALAFLIVPAPQRIGRTPSSRRDRNVLFAADDSVIRLTSLIRYPVKSGGAELLTEAIMTPEGVAGDRRFMVTRHDGSYLTQREIPRLATLEARTDEADSSSILLRSGGSSIGVNVQRLSSLTDASLFGASLKLVDQGADVGNWLAGALGPPPVRVGGGNVISMLQQTLQGAPPYRLLHAPRDGESPPLRNGAGLSDQAPYLLISEESLAALNEKRAGEDLPPVPMSRFRPNFVVSNCDGAHAEDGWSTVTIGDSKFRVIGPCPRCTVPDVEQASGERDTASDGPMATLKGYRAKRGRGVLFGVYLMALNPGSIVRVGDQVETE
mmetsp:Transcript_30683/g.47456  ORF Transcript_30683/g.47456 Transcript_30683/m.47456 type:complete len:345 (+) Transcript_30683:49-1083(+)